MPPDPALSPALDRIVRDQYRRIEALERRAQLPFSSMRGGALRLQDTAGEDRAVFGTVDLDEVSGDVSYDAQEAYGVTLWGDDSLALMTREGTRGLAFPPIPIPFSQVIGTFQTASTTFDNAFVGGLHFVPGEVAWVRFFAQTLGGSTGQVRLRDAHSDTTTDALTLGVDELQNCDFLWLHPATTGIYDPRKASEGRFESMQLFIQARVASGAGQVSVQGPHVAQFVPHMFQPGANAQGNPSFKPFTPV